MCKSTIKRYHRFNRKINHFLRQINVFTKELISRKILDVTAKRDHDFYWKSHHFFRQINGFTMKLISRKILILYLIDSFHTVTKEVNKDHS